MAKAKPTKARMSASATRYYRDGLRRVHNHLLDSLPGARNESSKVRREQHELRHAISALFDHGRQDALASVLRRAILQVPPGSQATEALFRARRMREALEAFEHRLNRLAVPERYALPEDLGRQVFLDVSTVHISPKDLILLNTRTGEGQPLCFLQNDEYCARLHVICGCLTSAEARKASGRLRAYGYSAAFIRIVIGAQLAGHYGVVFDCDADPNPRLKQFKHA